MTRIPTLILGYFICLCCQTSRGQSDHSKAGQLPVDTSFLLPVNGVDQYIEIKGVSKTNPILLFIHGGPSWPATPMIRKYNQNLTKDFVLVSWDQRNCGKSKNDSSAKLTPALYVEDPHEVTKFLEKKFHTKRIFVAWHSWGSIIGIYLIQKYPEDYAAYIGMGQFVDPNKSESLGRAFVLKQAKESGDTTTLNIVMSIPFSEQTGYQNGFDDLIRFSMLAAKYFKSPEVADLPYPATLYSDYSSLDWMTPVMTSGKVLFNYMNAQNINFFTIKDFKVPIYFFLGKYDHTTSIEVAEQYFETIQAPKKKLYVFEHSGHSPNWEEPELFYQRLLQVESDCKTN